MNPVRILLMGDSHLGFDLPTNPRVERRRRGHDFLANHRRSLEPALAGEVELVVHGGDLFHRPRVPPSLAFQAFQPLLEVAEAGVPVFLVPGNHERSRIPHDRFGNHPNLHIFREPTTFRVRVRETLVALSGFPYRRKIRHSFQAALHETGWDEEGADLRLLCLHHCVEGATVGPADYTFRDAPNVIRASELPGGFAAVLSGHIHRHQVLTRDLQGRPLRTRVYYSGSVERTAFAEASEEKGFLTLEARGTPRGGEILGHLFRRLPSRPMEVVQLQPPGGPGDRWNPGRLMERLGELATRAPADGVIQIRVQGSVTGTARKEISATSLRRIFPKDMNVQLFLAQERSSWSREGAFSSSRRPSPPPEPQHQLAL